MLPDFGRLVFGILGMAAQNTQWAHIEAVTSRQIAPKFGGDPYQNQKTQFHNNMPGMGGGNGGGGGPGGGGYGVASNAPR